MTATELAIGLNFGDPGWPSTPVPVEPLASIPPPCEPSPTDDCDPGRSSTASPRSRCSTSRRGLEAAAAPPERDALRGRLDPARYVDPTSGTVLVRFVNELTDGVGFPVDLSITGDVE